MSTTATPQQLHHSHAQRWLLAYDIRDPKRLARVGRCIRKEGLSLQYSVYVLKGSRQQIEPLLTQLREIIDATSDDIRVYPLTEHTRIYGLGTQFDNDNNTLSDAFMDKLIEAPADHPDPGTMRTNRTKQAQLLKK